MKVELIKGLLQNFSLFKELMEEEIDPIVEISHLRTYLAKSFVFMQGEPLDRVFFIYTGKVKIHKTDLSGKEQIVSILQAGEMFPHAGFFRTGNFPAHAEVLEETELIVIPVEQFEKILLKYPELSIKMFKVLGEKIIDLQNRLEEKILCDMYQQIVMLFLRLCKTNAVRKNDLYKLTSHFTNQELANMIGTSRETMNRTINQLRNKKLIKLDEDGCFLIHSAKLGEEIL